MKFVNDNLPYSKFVGPMTIGQYEVRMVEEFIVKGPRKGQTSSYRYTLLAPCFPTGCLGRGIGWVHMYLTDPDVEGWPVRIDGHFDWGFGPDKQHREIREELEPEDQQSAFGIIRQWWLEVLDEYAAYEATR